MDDKSVELMTTPSYSTTPRKYSAGSSWQMARSGSPWKNIDDEHEYLYNQAFQVFSEKLEDERMKLQTKLDEWMPKKGPYTDCKGRYHKICYIPKDYNGIHAIRFREDSQLLAIGYQNGMIEFIDLVNEMSLPYKVTLGSNHTPTSIKFSPKNEKLFYVSTTGGSIFLCDAEPADFETCQINKVISEGKNEIYGLDINCTGERIVTGGKDSRIRVYDLETHDVVTCYRGFAMECKDSYARLLEENEEEGHYLHVYCVVCHPSNPSVFASAGLDANIKIWDLRVKQFAVRNIHGPNVMGDAIDLKDNKVLSGQWASTEGLQMWDMGSCRCLQTFRPSNMSPQSFGQYFYCAKFLKTSNQSISEDLVVAGGSGMGGLIVGSFDENLIVALYEDEGSILSVDSRSTMLAYGGSNHVLYLSQFVLESNDKISELDYSMTLGTSSADAETIVYQDQPSIHLIQ